MPLKFEETQIGDTVYWMPYNGTYVMSGKVVYKKDRNTQRTTQYCIENGDAIAVHEGEKLFSTEIEAKLHSANQFNREAAEKLTLASELFQEAGIQQLKEAGRE